MNQERKDKIVGAIPIISFLLGGGFCLYMALITGEPNWIIMFFLIEGFFDVL